MEANIQYGTVNPNGMLVVHPPLEHSNGRNSTQNQTLVGGLHMLSKEHRINHAS